GYSSVSTIRPASPHPISNASARAAGWPFREAFRSSSGPRQHRSPRRWRVASDSIARARNALKGGDLDTAARIAAGILGEVPDNLDALEIRALVEVEQGDHAAAERSLRSAIALAPQRRWPYADLARLLLKLGRADDAEQVNRAALASDAD